MKRMPREFLTPLLAGLTAVLLLSVALTWAAPPPGKGGGGGGGEDPPPVEGPSYTITVLGTLGGGWATANGMNDFGDVVGTSENSFGDERSYLYTSETGMVPLNALVDPSSGWWIHTPEDINDLGVIVGYGYYDWNGDGVPDPPSMAIRFLPDDDGDGYGTVEDLFVTGSSARGMSVNSAGDIAGRHSIDGWRAFLWRPESGFQDLGEFDGGALPEAISERDANGDIQIVGRTSSRRAFRYTTGGGYEDLGTLVTDGSGLAEARDTNSFGDIAGWTHVGKNTRNAEDYAFLYVDGVGMSSLGTVSTHSTWNGSDARSLNDVQEVVGTWVTGADSSWLEGSVHRAFYWSPDTGMLDLEELIDNLPAEMEGTITPTQINNSSQICGPYVDNFNGISGPAYILSKNPQ